MISVGAWGLGGPAFVRIFLRSSAAVPQLLQPQLQPDVSLEVICCITVDVDTTRPGRGWLRGRGSRLSGVV